ncbi:GDSL-type esterase/lipase family protein [Pararhizobium capsulatum]|uniref:GDSL-type esterase/lipase family protein n=1 Tax=Pararhizobium capsulatum TaxID=34014 RepID=UPI003522C4C1
MSKQPVILCFGDSNTHGTPPMRSVTDLERFPPENRWPGVVRSILGQRAHIVEEAQPGRTTIYDDPTGGGDRDGLTALKIVLETHRPIDCIALMLGTNDLHARFNLSAWVISLNINQLVLKIKQMPCGPSAGEAAQNSAHRSTSGSGAGLRSKGPHRSSRQVAGTGRVL